MQEQIPSVTEPLLLRAGASASEESAALVKALEKQTVAIAVFAAAVVKLAETLRGLLDEEEGEADSPTYLNGDPIKR